MYFWLVLEPGDYHCVPLECKYQVIHPQIYTKCSYNLTNPSLEKQGNSSVCGDSFIPELYYCDHVEDAESIWIYDNFEMSKTGKKW